MAECELIADLRKENLRAAMGRLLMLCRKYSSGTTLDETLNLAGIYDQKERTLLRGIAHAGQDLTKDGISLEKVKYVKIFWYPGDPKSMEYEIDII